MHLFYAGIRGLDESCAFRAGRSSKQGSAFGMSLLAYAVKSVWGEELPEIGEAETGKPFFMHKPQWHFSISHTKTHVLCALSDFPVGADVETRREMRPSHVQRLTKGVSPVDLDFFQLWVLRESLYKLTGEGDLRKMVFSKDGENIIPPVPGVRCMFYDEIPGCAAALCTFQGNFPENAQFVPSALICS